MDRTQVTIIGAGPAGLILSHLPYPEGIESVVLEMHTAADVQPLSHAIKRFYRSGQQDLLACCSHTLLRRDWKIPHFSWWMTFHRFTGESGYAIRRKWAELDYVTGSRAAATALAENYTGLPLEDTIG